jgi:hypothetical protein
LKNKLPKIGIQLELVKVMYGIDLGMIVRLDVTKLDDYLTSEITNSTSWNSGTGKWSNK